MGWRLAEEVLDRLPGTVDPGARLFLCVLAQLADDSTRRVIPRPDLATIIARRTGLTTNGQRSAVRRLVKAGADPRIPIGVDRAGAPLFAVPGRALTYCIPEMPALPAGALSDSPTNGEGDLTDAPGALTGSPFITEGEPTDRAADSTSAAGASVSAPYASTKDECSSSAGVLTGSPSGANVDAAALRHRFGDAITAHEADDAVAWLRRERPDLTNLAGLFRSRRFSLDEALKHARSESLRREESDRAASQQRETRCDECGALESACRRSWRTNGHPFRPKADPIVTPTSAGEPAERAS